MHLLFLWDCYNLLVSLQILLNYFLKNNSVGFAKKLTNYNNPIEKANALKKFINDERKEKNDKMFKALYSIDEEKK